MSSTLIETIGMSIDNVLEAYQRLYEVSPPDIASHTALSDLEDAVVRRSEAVSGIVSALVSLSRPVIIECPLDETWGVPSIYPTTTDGAPFIGVFGQPDHYELHIGESPLKTCNNISLLAGIRPQDVLHFGERAHSLGVLLNRRSVPYGGGFKFTIPGRPVQDGRRVPISLAIIEKSPRGDYYAPSNPVSPPTNLRALARWMITKKPVRIEVLCQRTLNGLEERVGLSLGDVGIIFEAVTYITSGQKQVVEEVLIQQFPKPTVRYSGAGAKDIASALIRSVTTATDLSAPTLAPDQVYERAVKTILKL